MDALRARRPLHLGHSSAARRCRASRARSTRKEPLARCRADEHALARRRCASPCISVCVIDAARDRLCVGCLRTLDEIAAWSVLDDDERRDVLARIVARRGATQPRVPRARQDPTMRER